jgi:AAHS family 3-hydroxyphenylpropionic acid transporter
MTSQAAPAAGRRSNAAMNVALCFAVAVLEGFDIQAIGIARSAIANEFSIAPDAMAWVFFASNAALVVSASVGGWLADKIGRKPVFIASVLLFAVFTLLTALVAEIATLFEGAGQTRDAAELAALYAVRIGAGLGFGAALPNMMAIAADVSSPERRAFTAAMIFCGMPVGGGTVALITQAMPAGFDWRVLFYAGGVLPLLLVPFLLFFLSESRASTAERQRVNVLHAWFGEGRAAPSILLWLTFLPTLLILYLILYWLPTLVEARGFGGATAPQASLAFNYSSVVGALLFGAVIDRVGSRWPLLFGYAGLIASVAALAVATEAWAVLALSGLAGFFLLGANYALYGVASAYYPAAVRGSGAGGAVASGRIGSTIGPLLPGLLLAAGGSASEVINLMIPAAALAGLAVFAVSFFKRAED